MLDRLSKGERSVKDIASDFDMSRPAVPTPSRLLDAGLVAEPRHGRGRRYRLVPERLTPVRDWMAHYRAFWTKRVNRLEKLLETMDE